METAADYNATTTKHDAIASGIAMLLVQQGLSYTEARQVLRLVQYHIEDYKLSPCK